MQGKTTVDDNSVTPSQHVRLEHPPPQHAPPAKRARLGGSGGMKEIPLELMETILRYLSREDAKSMRCLCKDIERKVSPTFFRSIVVPFNSELQDMVHRDAGALKGICHGKGKGTTSDDIFRITYQPRLPWFDREPGKDDTFRGHGYKVFQGFGEHIRNFGMSFEVTADDLRKPPTKQILDDHVGYHGDYCWPPADYRRFEQLESLEKTADDSHLRDAMRNLKNVQALGLSLNNGCGYLASAPTHDFRPSIFGAVFPPAGVDTSDWSHSSTAGVIPWEDDLDSDSGSDTDFAAFLREEAIVPPNFNFRDDFVFPRGRAARRRVFNRLNYHEQRIPFALPMEEQLRLVFTAQMLDPPFRVESTRMIEQSQPGAVAHSLFQRLRTQYSAVTARRMDRVALERLIMSLGGQHDRLWQGLVFRAMSILGWRGDWQYPGVDFVGRITRHLDAIGQDDHVAAFVRNRQGDADALRQLARGNNTQPEPAQEERTLLGPVDFSQNQREWLLEADWAQRAFLQSYMLSIIDNAGIFSHVSYFNFACVSSTFVQALCRDDFWEALPGLNKLALYVLPECRHIERTDVRVLSNSLHPSWACDEVFRLLNDHIGKISNITTLEIGWERSAEDHNAAEIYRRFLPAPITQLANAFASSPSTVRLPHVRNLTLANCYMSPSSLKTLIRDLQECKLRTVTLSRACLMARSRIRTLNYRPPFNNAAREALGLSYRDGSWAVVINDISPSLIVPGLESDDSKLGLPRKLNKLEFKACAYAMSKASQQAQQGPDPRAGGLWSTWHAQQAVLGQFGVIGGQDPNAAETDEDGVAMGTDPHLAELVVDVGSKETLSLVHDYGFQVIDSHAGDPTDQQARWIIGDEAKFSGVLSRN
ncbi:hypothetical protein K461DRAFT_282800 [Myriangium duriaei CBS 260.36]|uniref:F-box domain-containing protein n=1 Tax=Myriangium duriaei CBS 260.36 TaxID=1168546 RepID=A0A9P4MCM1_9PEZI|nr:hypothetical protein K461DRAFT_282800 [Myriangium duriaei CBS 260.36]